MGDKQELYELSALLMRQAELFESIGDKSTGTPSTIKDVITTGKFYEYNAYIFLTLSELVGPDHERHERLQHYMRQCIERGQECAEDARARLRK